MVWCVEPVQKNFVVLWTSELWRGGQGFVLRFRLALDLWYGTYFSHLDYLNDNYRWFNHIRNCASLQRSHLRVTFCK
jgi:hypothetical protein